MWYGMSITGVRHSVAPLGLSLIFKFHTMLTSMCAYKVAIKILYLQEEMYPPRLNWRDTGHSSPLYARLQLKGKNVRRIQPESALVEIKGYP